MISIEPDQQPHHQKHTGVESTALPPHAPFVGREPERGQIHDSIHRMLAGQGQFVLLAGDPGIGKTRLAEEIAADARAQDVRVLWGRCYEWEGAPAFWPWIQLIRAHLRASDPDTIRRQFGSGAADIAQIVPEIQEHVSDLAPLPELDPAESRFRLFDAIASLLRNIAQDTPLMIVIDDLHRADTPSVMLVHFLTQEMHDSRLCILATYRPADVPQDHPLAPIISGLIRAAVCRRIPLQGLGKPSVGEFVTLVAGRESPPELIDAIFGETEGNPFFMTEVLRLLEVDGALDKASPPASWRIRVPESVREVIGRRLNRLSPACHDALAVASVIGRDFGLAILEPASGVARIELLDLLDEAIAIQVIHEDDTLGQYRFSHILIREVIYGQLTTSRRVTLHKTIGEALERTHAANLAPHFSEISHHFLQAAPAGDFERAIDYATRAGRQAMDQVAWEPAASHFVQALQALALQSDPDPMRRLELLLALGEAQNRIGGGSGDAPEARATFLQAIEIARTLGSAEHFAAAVIGYSGYNVIATFGGAQQIRLLEEALTLLGDDVTEQRVRILSRLALDLPNSESTFDIERIRAVGAETVALARRLGDPATLAYAIAARHFSGWAPDNLNERLAEAEELVDLVEVTGDLLSTAWARMIQLEDLVEAGDLARAERASEKMSQIGEQSRVPYVTLRSAVYRAMMLLLAGRYAEAEPLIEMGGGLWQSSSARQHQFQLFALRREQGRLAELRELVEATSQEPLTGITRYSHLADIHLPLLYLEVGEVELAREKFELVATQDFADIPFDMSWLSLLGLLAETCTRLGDRLRAQTLYDLLLPYAGQYALLAISAVCHGSTAYYLGLLATTLERWPDAERHYALALEKHEQMAMQPHIAHTRFAWAQMLDARNGPDDREAALDHARAAATLAAELGMTRLVERAEKLLAALESEQQTNASLSPREREVLGLVGQGMTDTEISHLLSISTRTVNAHMRSILAKLDVPSRAAATRVAVERGLLTGGVDGSR